MPFDGLPVYVLLGKVFFHLFHVLYDLVHAAEDFRQIAGLLCQLVHGFAHRALFGGESGHGRLLRQTHLLSHAQSQGLLIDTLLRRGHSLHLLHKLLHAHPRAAALHHVLHGALDVLHRFVKRGHRLSLLTGGTGIVTVFHFLLCLLHGSGRLTQALGNTRIDVKALFGSFKDFVHRSR